MQNDQSFTKIKEELSSHIIFGKQEFSDSKKVLKQRKGVNGKHKLVGRSLNKSDSLPVLGSNRLVPLTLGKTPISKERMKRFLNMTQDDLPREKKRVYACEKDIRLFSKPKDTLRCHLCFALYERSNKKEHLKNCPKNVIQQRKYACAICAFQHTDIKEIERHVEMVHKK